jgi:hypothetical protein
MLILLGAMLSFILFPAIYICVRLPSCVDVHVQSLFFEILVSIWSNNGLLSFI